QDQQRETEPQTAADALARAAELTQRADAADREAGRCDSYDTRQEIARLKDHAHQLRRAERREKARQDAAAIDAMRRQRHPSMGGGDAA
ncbi:hypothetical protein NGM37_29515, partial [Streptomyces sp. TRM76130]|nr:hypothetical protein [Streptomyces sp. TRM76130]